MIPAGSVSAVLVTRGDVDLAEPTTALFDAGVIDEVVVYDNGVGACNSVTWDGRVILGPPVGERYPDLAVYGRYAAIEYARGDLILVQDDDVILPAESVHALLAAYEPGVLTANMPERFREHYPDSCLVGFGAIFDRDLPALVFGRFTEAVPHLGLSNYGWFLPGEEKFNRTCDVIFTTLTERKLIDVPYADRPFASDAMRMWKQPGHFAERQQTLELARRVRDDIAVTS